MQRDDLAIVQLLKSLHGVADDLDDNSFDNTTIQFFESPHEAALLTAFFQTFIGGGALTTSPNETTTLTASLSANSANPATFTYGGYSADGLTLYQAGWYWGFGGVWK